MEAESLSTATRPRASRQHLPGLDGLRGLAILAVMCHHLMLTDYPAGIPGGVAGVVIKCFYKFFFVGWWGVDLFFVLSGFLITGILLEAKGTAHYFGNFYARRSLRIFPLYYGVLTLLFFVLPWFAANPATGAWTQRYAGDLLAIGQANAPLQKWLWFYGTNIEMAIASHGWIFGSLNHFWSLAVEEHFYLIWPVVVFCCSTRTLARVCLAVAAASLLCRAAFLVGGASPECIFALSPCRFDGLALGGFVAALARLWRNDGAPAPSRPISSKPGIRASIRLLLGIRPPADASNELLHAAFSRIFLLLLPLTMLILLTCYRFDGFMIIVGHTVLAATFAAALPGAALAQRSSAWARGCWLCLPPLQVLGKYSYGLYVIHPLIFQPLGNLLATPEVQNFLGGSYALTGILRMALGLTITLPIAWVIWHGFERHFLRLKRFFPTSGRVRSTQDKLSPGLPATFPASE
jgi:peptidoglycan/LPS O-acetylase OafA/YrhL